MLKSCLWVITCLCLGILMASHSGQAQNYSTAKRTPSANPAPGYPTAGSRPPPLNSGAAGGKMVSFYTEGSGTLSRKNLQVPFHSAIARWDDSTNLQIMFTTGSAAPPTNLPVSALTENDLWFQWEKDYVDFRVGLGFDGGPRSSKPTGSLLWISDPKLTRGSESIYFLPPDGDLSDYATTRATLGQYVIVKRLDRTVGGIVELEFKNCPYARQDILNGIVRCSVTK